MAREFFVNLIQLTPEQYETVSRILHENNRHVLVCGKHIKTGPSDAIGRGDQGGRANRHSFDNLTSLGDSVYFEEEAHSGDIQSAFSKRRNMIEDVITIEDDPVEAVIQKRKKVIDKTASLWPVSTKTRLLRCPYVGCNKVFYRQISLENHMRLHTELDDAEQPFTCPPCKKQLRNYESLFAHMSKVHEMQPFACVKCGGKFARKTDLNEHLSYGHKQVMPVEERKSQISNETIEDETAEDSGASFFNPFLCPHCDNSFHAAADRNNHLREVHNVETKLA